MGFDIKKLTASGAIVMAGMAAAQAADNCLDSSVDLRGDWGQAQFSIEIADDASERAKGLMFRETMGRMSGMLFVYEVERPVSFWMKNTILPLDMVFADATGVVQSIHENAIPGDLTPIFGGEAIKIVLEINAGTVETFGINVGSQLRHVQIEQKVAAWPCEGQ